MILLIFSILCISFSGTFFILYYTCPVKENRYKVISIILLIAFILSILVLYVGNYFAKDYTPTYEITEYEITEYSEDELFICDSLGRGPALICKCIDKNNEEIELIIHLHNTKISLSDDPNDTPKVIVEKPDNPWWYEVITFDNIFERYKLYL